MKEDQEQSSDALVLSRDRGLMTNSSRLVRRGLDELTKQRSIDSFLRIGVEFDEATYARVKPDFEAGLEHYKDMAPVEALKALMHELRDVHGFQLDQIGAMKPYVVRYIQELERESAWARVGELADEMGRGTVTDLDEIIARLFDDLAIIKQNSRSLDEETDR